jgi:hypothetical protein
MISKLVAVGLMVCGLGLWMQTANAQQWGGPNSGCQSSAPSGPEPSDWHGPTSYQPGPGQNQMVPPPAPQAPANQKAPGHGPMTYQQQPGQQPAQGAMNNQQAPAQQGPMAQSNNQSYQSFSAEPNAVPMNTYAPNTTYSYPYGYYGNSYNGGWNYGYPSYYGNTTNSGLDNARFHGVNPNAYP